MLVNNEIGVIQDIAALGQACHEQGIVFHVDAAQATGKVAIDLQALPVDLMSFSAHKTYGPKSIGALFARRKPRVRLEAQIPGGGHERGFRSGTLATHRSDEHTSELQSLMSISYAAFCLKKKKKQLIRTI